VNPTTALPSIRVTSLEEVSHGVVTLLREY
jgi:hypothetical protein